ncbi:MAG TPA: caspase family protein [Pyrinomonadaceae bacterium]
MSKLRHLLALALGAAALVVAATAPASSKLSEADSRKPFALVLPELGPQAITAPTVVIPHANLTRLRLRVYKPFADSIRYGRIYTTINGEAANTVFNFNADSEGYVINGDLGSRPRFGLRPGKNVVEILARADDKREYYASYVLLTADRRAGEAGHETKATVESLPAATGGDRRPPEVYLTQPSGPLLLKAGTVSVRVAGLVRDESGPVASVSVNGQAARLVPHAESLAVAVTPLAPVAPDELRGASRFEVSATVGPDAAAVVLEARDVAGNLARLTIPVTRRAAVVSPAFKGRKFALIVGVSKYRYPDGGLTNLAYAAADARAMRDFLTQPEGGGFAPGDIVYLEDERATIEAVRASLTQFLPKATADDLIFIFVAGHGDADPDARQNLYFLLHDTKVADMPSTALPMTELKDVLDQQVRAQRVVVFIDTCHSAGLSGEKPTGTRGLENNLINLYAAKLSTETGRAVITASDVNELSNESRKWGGGHGVFTWALLEGLRGGADADADRLVTAGELFDYVSAQVREQTDFKQNPRVVLPGLNAEFPLSFVTYQRRDR